MKKADIKELYGESAESRTFKMEFRADDDSKTIEGYGAVFDSLSENLGGFREKIEKGAFDDVLTDDVRALINHDPNLLLARTKSNTLKISVDDHGLRYSFTPPDTSYANDLKESITRGDLDQSSFAFTIEEDDWSEDDDGRVVRTIKKFRKLFDVSPVTYPAYQDATVAIRSMGQRKEDDLKAKAKNEAEARERDLLLLNS